MNAAIITPAIFGHYRLGGNARAQHAASADMHVARILIASSSWTERNEWSAELAGQGFELVEVKNGVGVLQAVSESWVDLVIAAVTMEKLDGLELARAFESMPDAPALILVAAGGRKMDRIYLKYAMLAGAAAGYTQPLWPKALLAGVRAALQSGRRQMIFGSI